MYVPRANWRFAQNLLQQLVAHVAVAAKKVRKHERLLPAPDKHLQSWNQVRVPSLFHFDDILQRNLVLEGTDGSAYGCQLQ